MSILSLCFETDTTKTSFDTTINKYKNKTDALCTKYDPINTYDACGAYGDATLPNKDAFTISNMLNLRTRLIPNNIQFIEQYQEHIAITYPNIKLWVYDVNMHYDFDMCNIVCIILFINGVYGTHYVCNIDVIEEQKKYILENVITKYKLYTQNNIKYEYVLLINTFDSNGKTETSTYETILEKEIL